MGEVHTGYSREITTLNKEISTMKVSMNCLVEKAGLKRENICYKKNKFDLVENNKLKNKGLKFNPLFFNIKITHADRLATKVARCRGIRRIVQCQNMLLRE